jgi:hypothetical protein
LLPMLSDSKFLCVAKYSLLLGNESILERWGGEAGAITESACSGDGM